jgi:hypothetical protein
LPENEVMLKLLIKFLKDQGYVRLAEDRPKIICLCGSSRFISHFAVMMWNLEKEGIIALGLHLLPSSYPQDHVAEHEGVADKMDQLHLRKIDLADEVIILNVDGYIGESTANEIAYAEEYNKLIRYLEPKENQNDK